MSVTLFLHLSEGVLYHIGLIHREGKRDEVCNDPRELTGSFMCQFVNWHFLTSSLTFFIISNMSSA